MTLIFKCKIQFVNTNSTFLDHNIMNFFKMLCFFLYILLFLMFHILSVLLNIFRKIAKKKKKY